MTVGLAATAGIFLGLAAAIAVVLAGGAWILAPDPPTWRTQRERKPRLARAGRSADLPRRSVSRRWLAAVLLVAAAVLFGIGTSYEAAERSEHSGDPHGDREQILGIDATSPTVIGTGIVLSLVAAAAVVAYPRRPVAYGVAAFAAVFAVLDLAEATHGLREGEPSIDVLALIIAALHGAAAVIAYRIASAPASPVASVAPGNCRGEHRPGNRPVRRRSGRRDRRCMAHLAGRARASGRRVDRCWHRRARRLRVRRHPPRGQQLRADPRRLRRHLRRRVARLGDSHGGFKPDRYDYLGATICLVGVAVIMFAPRAA